ncbi:MAG: DUF2993 domain-containing protein [Firmicutes bacterium]|nr:DUF2993 domain-containing protein [Bacillota bacterium]
MPSLKNWARLVLICSLLVIAVLLFSGMTLINHYLERSLAQAIARETKIAEEVSWRLAPLGLIDLIRGRTRDVEFSAGRLAFHEGPVLEDLTFKSRGIQLNRNALLFERRIEVQELAKTELTFRITEAGLTAFLREEWPEFNPRVELSPGAVRIQGVLREPVLKERLPFTASARLEQASGNSLRLTPVTLKIGDLEVPPGVVAAYLDALDLQFPLELPWPLTIKEFRVEEGFLRMEWREK